MSASFNFDSEEFSRSIRRQVEDAAKERIREIVRKVSPMVTVSFEGSLEDNTLKVNLSGEEHLIEQARLALQD